MNLNEIKKAYFVGIKGAGMTAVAEIFKNRGIEVSGSDTSEKFFTDRILLNNQIKFKEHFSEKNITEDIDLVVYSTAYTPANNLELRYAEGKNLKMLSYPEVIGQFFKEKMGIAVCGTHGKTTTTAMLAEVLREAGEDPTAIVGSQVIQWNGSSIAGRGNYFVAEADEYQNKLQYYSPWSVILTSLDWDHPDFYPTFAEYRKAFEDFVSKIPHHGFLIAWGDSTDTRDLAQNANCTDFLYGFNSDNDYAIKLLEMENGMQKFKIRFREKEIGEFELGVPGKHNILNATSVIAFCHHLKLDLEKVKTALKNFQGTSRRFEYIGLYKKAILIDDYSHHPEEIKAALLTARNLYPQKNIITIFHPHTFTRTKALLQEFAQSFDDTDKVIVIDIYGSAREEQGGVSSADLVNLINKYAPANPQKAEYIPTIDEVVAYLKESNLGDSVVITMGAGNVWQIAQKLNVKKIKVEN
jgi:UDP-N-acetylmuramate--alanine ligase